MKRIDTLFAWGRKWIFDPSEFRAYFAPKRWRRAGDPRAWFDLGFKLVDARRLDFYLRWLVVSLLIYFGTWLVEWREWLTDYGFHYTAETRHWYNPDPWPTLPGWAVILFAAALFGSGLMILWGWKTRVMIWLFFVCTLVAMLVDVDSAFTINKYAVALTFLIGLSYGPGMFCWWKNPDGERIRLHPVWPIRLIMLACFIQYFTSGYCKVVHGDWLQPIDEFPYRQIDDKVLWTQTMGVYRTHFAALVLNHMGPWFWKLGMGFTLFFELGAPLLLGIRPLRPLGMWLGIALHLGIALLMYKLVYFSLQMVIFYLLFLEESSVVRLHTWFGLRLKQPLINAGARLGEKLRPTRDKFSD